MMVGVQGPDVPPPLSLTHTHEFGVLMEVARLLKMCLNQVCSKVRIGKHLSDNFPI
jgi:hypothetical protein